MNSRGSPTVLSISAAAETSEHETGTASEGELAGLHLSLTVLAICACIAYNECMQYTIRNIPSSLDAALRQRAHEQGKSLNEIAIEALARGAGISGERIRKRDLSDIVGTWQEDPAFDEAIADQDKVDEEMWR
jgi:plasmid stability protein